MEDPISFNEAMFSLADGWLRYWLLWLGYALVLTPLILAFSRDTRRDAVIVAVTNVMAIALTGWLYRQIGYVRLLGIVHIMLWTPLLIYLVNRSIKGVMTRPFRTVIWIFAATLAVSLVFDCVDVSRYMLGERESMLVSKQSAR